MSNNPRGRGTGRGRGVPPRGAGPPGRGGGPAARGGAPAHVGGPTAPGNLSAPLPAAHVKTVGVKRKAPGTQGTRSNVVVNMFQFQTNPDGMIYHYDVVITANQSNKTFPVRFNLEIIKQLQELTEPGIFTPKAVYDGKKNLFSPRRLALTGPSDTQSFNVTFGSTGRAAPIVYTVRLTLVNEISADILDRFVRGEHAQDNEVLTAIMALNVVIRMDPISRYPSNVRSFFMNNETRNLLYGLEAWRGLFQSVRPSPGRLLLNLDISSGVLYKPGPLINLCMEYLGRSRDSPDILSPARGFDRRVSLKLQSFLKGVRISIGEGAALKNYTIQGLSAEGADRLTFTHNDTTITVAQYFQRTQRPLRHPGIICAKVTSRAFLPLEKCTVLRGQLARKEIPEDAMAVLREFSTKRPADRLKSIRDGLAVLNYGQSDYIRQFGITIDTTNPMKVPARILQPPALKYGPGSKVATTTPRDGKWNMADKKMLKPATIRVWMVLIFEGQNRFPMPLVDQMVKDFMDNCKPVGMSVLNEPIKRHLNPQGNIGQLMKAAGAECMREKGQVPDFVMAVLPDHNNGDIYKAIKFHGDTVLGVATQCLKASKCRKANAQYWANVLLKVNPKLAGQNWEHASVPAFSDPNTPTMIMGADVIHPGPGNTTTPSFAALTASVDLKGTLYVAEDRVQQARQEIIADLGAMAKSAFQMFNEYQVKVEKKPQSAKPKRVIFFRDGVSEGQFQQVLDQEVPMIKSAMRDQGINAKLTFIVVGKRHHIRFFPENENQGDRSGNCPAGTVVDQGITHPLEFDFYLQSHGGLLGTSRSAHYSVLYDENNFTPDALQALSFQLCHIYARATRSVSIPAPVYYADLVCGRAKSRFDPQANMTFSDTGSTTGTATSETQKLEKFQREFKPLHNIHKKRMYFL